MSDLKIGDTVVIGCPPANIDYIGLTGYIVNLQVIDRVIWAKVHTELGDLDIELGCLDIRASKNKEKKMKTKKYVYSILRYTGYSNGKAQYTEQNIKPTLKAAKLYAESNKTTQEYGYKIERVLNTFDDIED
jgi:hypothetical protein